MEALQTQIDSLSAKIDALYGMVERITEQIAEIVARKNQHLDATDQSSEFRSSLYAYAQVNPYNSGTTHKDILIDSPYSEPSRSEHTLSPEVQIQRLTAQLTAAYNRIAALEEQLLAHRVAH